ncbi:MAG: MarR family transcriptional regulator, partial [Bacteroidota bacterium]
MDFQLPQNTVFYQLEKTMKLYRKLAQNRIHTAGYNVSVNQLILLVQLNERPASTQVELSASIFKDFASVARMVDLLVKKGFLARSENAKDRRKKDLKPTPVAKEMLQVLYPVIL